MHEERHQANDRSALSDEKLTVTKIQRHMMCRQDVVSPPHMTFDM